MMKIKLNQITIDAGTQTRVKLNEETIADYAEAMTKGAKFPNVVVFASGTDYLLADGFHRFMAAQRCGWREITVEVRKGSRLDAVKYSLGANTIHGLPRTSADKRRCVEIALKEFAGMSDRVIAEMCAVGAPLVGAVSNCNNLTVDRTTRIGKDGKARAMPKTAQDVFKEIGGKPTRKEAIKMRPPCCGMMIAGQAIVRLEEIAPNDTERTKALNHVKKWIHDNEN